MTSVPKSDGWQCGRKGTQPGRNHYTGRPGQVILTTVEIPSRLAVHL